MAVKIKTFEITGNYSPESVSSKIAAFLRSDKETETQLASYSGGYVLQAGKRSFLEAHGQRVAVTARFEAENGTLNVAAGEGLWSQKLGESKTGWFLADTSGLGAAYDPYEKATRTVLTAQGLSAQIAEPKTEAAPNSVKGAAAVWLSFALPAAQGSQATVCSARNAEHGLFNAGFVFQPCLENRAHKTSVNIIALTAFGISIISRETPAIIFNPAL